MQVRWLSILIAVILWFISLLQVGVLALGWYWSGLSYAGPVGGLISRVNGGESAAIVAVAAVFSVFLLSFPAHMWKAWQEHEALAKRRGQPLQRARARASTLPTSSAARRRLELLLMWGKLNADMLREALAGQSAADAMAIESRFRLTHALIWVLPVLGFMGTALALTQSIGGFGEALKLNLDIPAISARLQQTVIPGLAQAFMVTVVALLGAVVAYVGTVTVQGWQSDTASELDAATSIWFGEASGGRQAGGEDLSRITAVLYQITQQLSAVVENHKEMAVGVKELQSAAKDLQGAAREVEKSWKMPFKVTIDRS